MKFRYPFWAYVMTFLLLCGLGLYGLVMIKGIRLDSLWANVYVVAFFVSLAMLGRYYLRFVRENARRYIEINDQGILIHDLNQEVAIQAKALDCIILAKHLQFYKTHTVIHIFTLDGRYVYVTKDINHFDNIVSLLETHYPDRFYRTRKVVKGVHEITKGFLWTYL